jgi:hypothetical protein
LTATSVGSLMGGVLDILPCAAALSTVPLMIRLPYGSLSHVIAGVAVTRQAAKTPLYRSESACSNDLCSLLSTPRPSSSAVVHIVFHRSA